MTLTKVRIEKQIYLYLQLIKWAKESILGLRVQSLNATF